MVFTPLRREMTAKGRVGVTYSLLRSGHGNIYLLSGLAPKVNYPFNSYVVFYLDTEKQLVALAFEKEEGQETYKLTRKMGNRAGQLVVHAKAVTNCLVQFGYPEKQFIEVVKHQDLWVLKKP